ncbi:glycosyltransferase family 2 protein, partial [Xylella fastidiosa subsp. multiplex]|nr:glycosyltransferase family 2 protein [Xylella fastidiosa subsp. multiplex]
MSAPRHILKPLNLFNGDGQHSAADFPRLLAAANYHP